VATDIARNSGVDAPRGAGDADRAATRLTTAPDAARQIVDGMVKGRFRVVVGRDARLVDVMSRVSPRRATETVARRMASLLGA
jgi:hypothetical protein